MISEIIVIRLQRYSVHAVCSMTVYKHIFISLAKHKLEVQKSNNNNNNKSGKVNRISRSEQ